MKLTAFIEGVGVGILAAYLLDPDRGTRRRAVMRDKALHYVNRKRTAARIMVTDFANRTKGVRSRVHRRLHHSAVGDDVLVERVRSELGRHVSHFHALTISCENSTVTLSGPILASEVQDCIWHARMVPGVKHVMNSLEPHASAQKIPALQGGVPTLVHTRWTPATSLVLGGAGALMTILGMAKGGLGGKALQLVGVGLVSKAFHDTEHRFDPSPTGRPNSQSKNRAVESPAHMQGVAVEAPSALS